MRLKKASPPALRLAFSALFGAMLWALPSFAAGPIRSTPEDPSLAFTDGDSSFVRETLDQKKIHALYNNGDFDPVIEVLEGFMKRNKTYSHSDSVFIAKHLAVVYTANPGTRERGKYYMYRLLELMPSAKLVDMFVSDEVDRIFDKVREEFLVRQKHFGVDTTGLALPERPRGEEEPRKPTTRRKRSWIPWTAAVAAGGVAVATGAYFILQTDEGEKKPPVEDVDMTVTTPRN
jgi:hypothetical protein